MTMTNGDIIRGVETSAPDCVSCAGTQSLSSCRSAFGENATRLATQQKRTELRARTHLQFVNPVVLSPLTSNTFQFRAENVVIWWRRSPQHKSPIILHSHLVSPLCRVFISSALSYGPLRSPLAGEDTERSPTSDVGSVGMSYEHLSIGLCL